MDSDETLEKNFWEALSFFMSLAEIEEAVKTLTPEELAKLAAFVARDRIISPWDAEIDADFSPGGKHASALEKIDAEIEGGKF